MSEWPLKWDDSLDMFCFKKKYLIIKLIYIFMVCLQVKKTHTCFFKKMLVFVKMSGNNDIISFWCLLHCNMQEELTSIG